MNAPGWPGLAPTWSSSDKDVVGTALGPGRVWYTLGYGVLDEVYWPSCSTPQIRDLGFIVAGDDFWSEVKREQQYELSTPAPDVPLPKVVHRHERYRLELEVLADPHRDVVLVRYRLEGKGLRLYALLAPHLDGSGHDNTAEVQPHGLAAVKPGAALLLAADGGFSRASAGYVGTSDGWQDFEHNGAMTWHYDSAPNGNVALMGELADNEGVLGLGFADTVEGARTLALSSLACGFEAAREQFVAGWKTWAGHLQCEGIDPALQQAVRRAAMVLKTHNDRDFPGAMVASLSVPWGDTRDDPGGYHLVWPRDAVESGFAMLACAHHDEARAMLAYLIATQQPDGHWLQNFYADGRPYWAGIQLDEAALPVLLAARLDELDQLGDLRPEATVMVRRALRFVVRNGPLSAQDRWEENAGINPFTLATAIAALTAGAAHGFLDKADATYALSLADDWNARVESWTYARDTELDRKHGTRGHYVRIVPPGQTPDSGDVALRNRGRENIPARQLLGLEYLYLVRLGLRAPDDPRIRDTTRLVDAELRVELPGGPYYHRYNQDGYGEHEDGRSFDGTGIGRAWPLLSGERAHYALLAGEDPRPYLDAMLSSASQGGMLPEQVWDAAPIPERNLLPGRPTGSAMPLVWAHAELIKLVVAIHRGHAVECLRAVADRYARPRLPGVAHWRDQVPCHTVNRKGTLLVEAASPFVLHLGRDGWKQVDEHASQPTAFGMHGVRLEVASLGAQRTLEFTRRFLGERGWEGRDWVLQLVPLAAPDRHA
ncbi:glycoside hydrolase family 15 protein [Dyella sp. A6]|uniref:glycoside hydrolase family 15 protein n=1 Tax=Dyella aluminiiresistens TaxID=3069105 RepID=UPI002E75A5A2|nr:glycoside hydrolase family 15 protein [Dyella sp. A6]